MRKPSPPVALLSRVIEPPMRNRRSERPSARSRAAQAVAAQFHVDRRIVAHSMTSQAAVGRTPVMEHVDAALPTEGWYEIEDPFTTATTDAAFARFMAGDNPHVRTDEVPVVDFTSMIDVVGSDGRPVKQASGRRTRLKVGLIALVTTAALSGSVMFGLIDVPGAERIPDSLRSIVSISTVGGSEPLVGESIESEPTLSEDAPGVVSSTSDADANVEQQPMGATADG